MTPSRLRFLIYTKAEIDVGRIHVREEEAKFIVGIAGLTEHEQHTVNGGLRLEGFEPHTFEVVEDPAPEKVKHYDLEKLTGLLAAMHDAPDGELDKIYAKRCADFAKEGHNLEETLEFIRDTRDWCVFTSGASSTIMILWNFMLEDYPEPDDVKKARRAKLDAAVGM